MSQKHVRNTTEKLRLDKKTVNGYRSAKDHIGTSLAGTREELWTGALPTNLFRGLGRETLFP